VLAHEERCATLKCAYCGHSEVDLCSPFVVGQTPEDHSHHLTTHGQRALLLANGPVYVSTEEEGDEADADKGDKASSSMAMDVDPNGNPEKGSATTSTAEAETEETEETEGEEGEEGDFYPAYDPNDRGYPEGGLFGAPGQVIVNIFTGRTPINAPPLEVPYFPRTQSADGRTLLAAYDRIARSITDTPPVDPSQPQPTQFGRPAEGSIPAVPVRNCLVRGLIDL